MAARRSELEQSAHGRHAPLGNNERCERKQHGERNDRRRRSEEDQRREHQ